MIPLVNYGLKAMSMGFLVPPENAIVWRGLMVMKALQQLLHDVDWDGLDVLVIDMPPGTGDTQLTITQQIVLDGSFFLLANLSSMMQVSRLCRRHRRLH